MFCLAIRQTIIVVDIIRVKIIYSLTRMVSKCNTNVETAARYRINGVRDDFSYNSSIKRHVIEIISELQE